MPSPNFGAKHVAELIAESSLNLESGASHFLARSTKRRFSHSPSGGGPPSATEPAWDWQFIIPEYEVAREYSYRARVVYRERCTRDEVLEEYKNWRTTLRGEFVLLANALSRFCEDKEPMAIRKEL